MPNKQIVQELWGRIVNVKTLLHDINYWENSWMYTPSFIDVQKLSSGLKDMQWIRGLFVVLKELISSRACKLTSALVENCLQARIEPSKPLKEGRIYYK